MASRKEYEEYLNDMYLGEDLRYNDRWNYLRSPKLLQRGMLGTALKKHDPIAFNIGYNEWIP